jgi:hypothetical protein
MTRLNSTRTFYFYSYFYAAVCARGRIVTPND